jgi:fructose/tagatose bisphosphate aldolase
LKTISQKAVSHLFCVAQQRRQLSILEKAVKYGATLDGAKGGSEHQLQQAINLGVTKINIDIDLRLVFTATIREVLTNSPKEFDPRKNPCPSQRRYEGSR